MKNSKHLKYTLIIFGCLVAGVTFSQKRDTIYQYEVEHIYDTLTVDSGGFKRKVDLSVQLGTTYNWFSKKNLETNPNFATPGTNMGVRAETNLTRRLALQSGLDVQYQFGRSRNTDIYTWDAEAGKLCNCVIGGVNFNEIKLIHQLDNATVNRHVVVAVPFNLKYRLFNAWSLLGGIEYSWTDPFKKEDENLTATQAMAMDWKVGLSFASSNAGLSYTWNKLVIEMIYKRSIKPVFDRELTTEDGHDPVTNAYSVTQHAFHLNLRYNLPF